MIAILEILEILVGVLLCSMAVGAILAILLLWKMIFVRIIQ